MLEFIKRSWYFFYGSDLVLMMNGVAPSRQEQKYIFAQCCGKHKREEDDVLVWYPPTSMCKRCGYIWSMQGEFVLSKEPQGIPASRKGEVFSPHERTQHSEKWWHPLLLTPEIEEILIWHNYYIGAFRVGPCMTTSARNVLEPTIVLTMKKPLQT